MVQRWSVPFSSLSPPCPEADGHWRELFLSVVCLLPQGVEGFGWVAVTSSPLILKHAERVCCWLALNCSRSLWKRARGRDEGCCPQKRLVL